MRREILEAIGEDGMAFAELTATVREIRAVEGLEKLGSSGWQGIPVKPNMGGQGVLKRVAAKGPQRLVLAWFPFSFGKLTPYRA